jgi:predicted DNA-binding protein
MNAQRMSYSLEDLRAAPDAELIERHDRLAENTSVGVSYYLEELADRVSA